MASLKKQTIINFLIEKEAKLHEEKKFKELHVVKIASNLLRNTDDAALEDAIESCRLIAEMSKEEYDKPSFSKLHEQQAYLIETLDEMKDLMNSEDVERG